MIIEEIYLVKIVMKDFLDFFLQVEVRVLLFVAKRAF